MTLRRRQPLTLAHSELLLALFFNNLLTYELDEERSGQLSFVSLLLEQLSKKRKPPISGDVSADVSQLLTTKTRMDSGMAGLRGAAATVAVRRQYKRSYFFFNFKRGRRRRRREAVEEQCRKTESFINDVQRF